MQANLTRTSSPSRQRLALRWLAVALLALAGVGCSSVGAASSDLIAEEPPLTQVGLADVESATSSCEGLLDDVIDFAVLGETGLVVGLDGIGDAVCIDTVEAVNAELGDEGRVGDAIALSSRYEVTMALRSNTPPNAPHAASRQQQTRIQRLVLAGDPDPEPNCPQPTQQTPHAQAPYVRPGI